MEDKPGGLLSLFAIIVLLSLASCPGCLSSCTADRDLTETELADLFMSQADAIRDYRSEYSVFSGMTGEARTVTRIRYDCKSPFYARMQIIESGSRTPGTFATTNGSTTAWYDADSRTYDMSSNTDLPREYDYQSMVRRIIEDRAFTILEQNTTGEQERYLVEVETLPWSTSYTPYLSSRIRAWIEPSTGLAWAVMTYYDCNADGVPTPTPSTKSCRPSDVPNRVVRYETIEVNTGVPDSYFEFIPPEGSGPRCIPKYEQYVEPPRTDTSVPITKPLPGGVDYSLNENDSGRVVTMHPGDVIEITLPTIPGLAYRWIMPSEGSCLELMNAGSIFEMPEDGDFRSCRGYYRWRFRAVSTGTQAFDGVFALDGCGVQNARRFNLTVKVTDTG